MSEVDVEIEETENKEMKIKENTCLEYLSLLALFIFGSFICYTFLPIKILSSNKLWIDYSDTCCSVIRNVTRCNMNVKCKHLLDLWISFQNSTRNFYECCYWYGNYLEWRIYSSPFCDPFCIRPKIF